LRGRAAQAQRWAALVEVMKEQSLKHLFELAGRECGHWLSRANALKRGADLILDELNKSLAIYPYGRAPYEELALFLPYMLLSGYALENLMKGILVEKNPSIVSNGEFTEPLSKVRRMDISRLKWLSR
jgi:hypothetical protein